MRQVRILHSVQLFRDLVKLVVDNKFIVSYNTCLLGIVEHVACAIFEALVIFKV